METPLFEEILNQAGDFNITSVCLTGFGEPLFDPNLIFRVQRVREVFRKIPISIYTNGVLLTEQRINDLVRSGLTDLYVSLNAATATHHEQIMGIDGKFDQIVKMIEYALDIPGLNVCIPVAISPEYIEAQEVILLQQKFKPKNLFMHYVANWGGKLFDLKYKPQHSECRWFDREMYINIKGDVCLCCYDPLGEHAFGNIKQKPLFDIWWTGRRFFLERIEKEGRGNVAPCNNCTTN